MQLLAITHPVTVLCIGMGFGLVLGVMASVIFKGGKRGPVR